MLSLLDAQSTEFYKSVNVGFNRVSNNVSFFNPLVTIYIPTYNRRILLERAVRSALSQTYQNIEVIVVDDQSEDETIDFLKKVSEEDRRLRFLKNEKNSGACVSRNRAIFEAKGLFITGLDDDDYFSECRIQEFIDYWQNADDEVVALYSNLLRKTNVGLKKASRRMASCRFSDLVFANWPGNQVFTKTEFLMGIGGFDPDLPAWQDLDCWYRLLKHKNGSARCVPTYSYILDVSHSDNRISQQGRDKLEEAWQIFCTKNNFDERQKQIAKLMLASYGDFHPSFTGLCYKILGMKNRHNIRHALVLFYLGMLSAIKG